jgi:hypothetical protein
MITTTRTLRGLALDPRRLATLRERLADALARVRAWREARAAARLDGHHVRERNAHERYLAQARDVFELERLERDWQRRHSDLWRVY